VTLGRQIIYLLRLNFSNYVKEIPCAPDVTMMKVEARLLVRILVKMVDSVGVERAGPTDNAMNFVSLPKKKFGKI
jgi:hypothetical protein